MKLARIDQAIEVCEEHLTKTGSAGSEIEAFLTRYLLILVCASFEEEIERAILRRVSRMNDPPIEAFVRSTFKSVFRNMKTSEIAGLLGRFGPDYKNNFQVRINGSAAEVSFNNIVNNRNEAAHRQGVNVTFQELVKAYEDGHVVLDAIEDVCS